MTHHVQKPIFLIHHSTENTVRLTNSPNEVKTNSAKMETEYILTSNVDQ